MPRKASVEEVKASLSKKELPGPQRRQLPPHLQALYSPMEFLQVACGALGRLEHPRVEWNRHLGFNGKVGINVARTRSFLAFQG